MRTRVTLSNSDKAAQLPPHDALAALCRRKAESFRENNHIPVRSIVHFTMSSLPPFYGKDKSQKLYTNDHDQ